MPVLKRTWSNPAVRVLAGRRVQHVTSLQRADEIMMSDDWPVHGPMYERAAQALIDAASRNQRILQVGHVERFNPVVALARQRFGPGGGTTVVIDLAEQCQIIASGDVGGGRRRHLAQARLELGEVSRELRLMLDEGEVVGQQPAPGDSLPAGSGVDVVVATTRIEMTVPDDIFR